MNTDRAWYLILTKSRQERIAVDNLERQQYETYLPLLDVRRRKDGEFVVTSEPMFPRYLFISLSDTVDNWGPIRSTRGVAGLVRFGGQPSKVPDALIQCLRENSVEQSKRTSSAPSFTKGDRVIIMEGPFAGYEAIFEAANSQQRVSVLLNIVDGEMRLSVGVGSLDRR